MITEDSDAHLFDIMRYGNMSPTFSYAMLPAVRDDNPMADTFFSVVAYAVLGTFFLAANLVKTFQWSD